MDGHGAGDVSIEGGTPNPDDAAAIAAGIAAMEEAETYRQELRVQAWQAIRDLEDVIDTPNAQINAAPAPYIKGQARVLKVLIQVTLGVVERDL